MKSDKGVKGRMNAFVAAGLLLFASAGLAAADLPGKATFTAHCAGCHGADGKGSGERAIKNGFKARDLTKLTQDNQGDFPYLSLRRMIDGRVDKGNVRAHYEGGMPVWGKVFAEEESRDPGNAIQADAMVKMRILDIIDYLASIQEQCTGKCD